MLLPSVLFRCLARATSFWGGPKLVDFRDNARGAYSRSTHTVMMNRRSWKKSRHLDLMWQYKGSEGGLGGGGSRGKGPWAGFGLCSTVYQESFAVKASQTLFCSRKGVKPSFKHVAAKMGAYSAACEGACLVKAQCVDPSRCLDLVWQQHIDALPSETAHSCPQSKHQHCNMARMSEHGGVADGSNASGLTLTVKLQTNAHSNKQHTPNFPISSIMQNSHYPVKGSGGTAVKDRCLRTKLCQWSVLRSAELKSGIEAANHVRHERPI